MERALASPASGPVARSLVFRGCQQLVRRTASGSVFQDSGFRKLERLAQPPARGEIVSARTPPALPEPGALVRVHPSDSRKLFALAEHLYRSDDGGRSWINLTGFNHESIIGPNQHELPCLRWIRSKSYWPTTPGYGAHRWRLSLDRPEPIPAQPARRQAGSRPSHGRGMRIEVAGTGAFEWMPASSIGPSSGLAAGVRPRAWNWKRCCARLFDNAASRNHRRGRLGCEIGLCRSARRPYLGIALIPANLESHSSGGIRPRSSVCFVDAQSPRVALAALSGKGPHVLRTTNTADSGTISPPIFADASAYGVTADRAAGVVYAATGRGVFFARVDLEGAGPASSWVLR